MKLFCSSRRSICLYKNYHGEAEGITNNVGSERKRRIVKWKSILWRTSQLHCCCSPLCLDGKRSTCIRVEIS